LTFAGSTTGNASRKVILDLDKFHQFFAGWQTVRICALRIKQARSVAADRETDTGKERKTCAGSGNSVSRLKAVLVA